jgi:hypothetical protein
MQPFMLYVCMSCGLWIYRQDYQSGGFSYYYQPFPEAENPTTQLQEVTHCPHCQCPLKNVASPAHKAFERSQVRDLPFKGCV